MSKTLERKYQVGTNIICTGLKSQELYSFSRKVLDLLQYLDKVSVKYEIILVLIVSGSRHEDTD